MWSKFHKNVENFNRVQVKKPLASGIDNTY